MRARIDVWNTSTRFFPFSLASYMAASASLRSCSVGLVPTGVGHADADRQPDLVTLEVRCVAEHRDDAVGELHGRLRVLHIDHQDRELVASEAGDGVARAHDRREQPGCPQQDAVTDVVAEGVVDRLESVEVSEAEGDRPPRSGCRGQGVLNPVVEERTVGQPGELVVEGQMAKVGLQGVALPVGGLEGVGVVLRSRWSAR